MDQGLQKGDRKLQGLEVSIKDGLEERVWQGEEMEGSKGEKAPPSPISAPANLPQLPRESPHPLWAPSPSSSLTPALSHWTGSIWVQIGLSLAWTLLPSGSLGGEVSSRGTTGTKAPRSHIPPCVPTARRPAEVAGPGSDPCRAQHWPGTQ